MPEIDSDLEEFTNAYMAYYPLLLSAALNRVCNKTEAEDICQEVFTIFFEKMTEIENYKTWLMGTLKFVTFRYYRDKNRDTSDIEESFDNDKLAYVNGFRDTRILIGEAMNAIECSEQERVLLDLIAVHNFSYKNVAGILGLTRRQVEYNYGILVKKFTDYLQKKGIQDLEELL